MRASQNEMPSEAFVWTRGIAAREAMHYLDRHGIDTEPLFAKAEISRAQLLQNPVGISAASQHRFLELAAVEADEPLLGLHVAAAMDLREFGLLFYLAASTATVAEAVQHLALYAATTSQEIYLEVASEREHAEFLALAFNRVLHQLTNRNFAPLRIGFTHTRDEPQLQEIHRILHCPVDFMQPMDSCALAQRVMELPIVSADHHLLHILQAYGDDLLTEPSAVTGWRGLVEGRLLGLLSSGRAQAAIVAERLGMSERSFRRRLAEEGTTFAEILDDLRRRLAVRYLDEAVSMKQIAWLLGYSESSGFNHPFKRWTGTAPGEARKSRVAGQHRSKDAQEPPTQNDAKPDNAARQDRHASRSR
jgi:AraC-like DNA-binding protein